MPAEAVDRHLGTCAACRSWFARAERLNRTMLVRAAPPVPDLTEAILDRTPAPSGERWGFRIALAVVAVAQLTLAFAQLFGRADGLHGQHGGGFMVGHLSHESIAWNLAVGVGLLFAALRPGSATGQLPLLAGFVLMLTALSTADVLGQEVTFERIFSHLPAVLGVLLLFVVRRQFRNRHDPRPQRYGATGRDERAETSTPDAPAAVDRPHRPHRFWRPASRRRAA